MQEIIEIEEACASGNHETVVSMLESIDSFDIKKEAFLKIIGYYENKSLFATGYVLSFVKWLIFNRDYKTAMEYINKCRKKSVAEERLSQLIFESLIKPDETFYKEKFNKNLRLLRENNILFSEQEFDFDQIKKQLLIIADYQPAIPESLLEKVNGKRPLLIDIINVEFINNLLNVNYVYLVYNDVKLFYYMLLFEDFSGIDQYIKQKRLIFFLGKEKKILEDFFLNSSTITPAFCLGESINEKYTEIINEIVNVREEKHQSTLRALNDIYKDHDYRYYRDLFAKGPSDIKIMLITSDKTEINQFIVRNWYEAFLQMGYQVKLVIESEPYEYVCNHLICDSMNEFKPDIVFYINFTVNDIFHDEGEAGRNILWISRYRDSVGSELYHAEPGYKYNNMFILPVALEWEEELKKIGVPENRILSTSDGININIFTKKEKINKQHACDIVNVNNAVGSLNFRLNYYLENITNENVKKVILELVDELKEIVSDETVIFYLPNSDNFIDRLNKRIAHYGGDLTKSGKIYMDNFFLHIMDSLCRATVMEWIIDSGITKNIRLWGKGWSNCEKFKKYHMGVAQHGEELSAIYRSSKISISDSSWALHERNFEIMASGGFPLIRYVQTPEVEEMNKITNHFKENEEVVLFYSKDDLLNKIQYYLDNPEERERIAENGRNVVMHDFTNIAIARKTMEFIGSYYRE
ncbi:MAG TPA: hypothetical protein ENG83_04285 [Nitrospirae bacterium]|nr:spore protein YkvP [bacterium BMS3Abin06]HDH11409.1 hypothetical protein [Nitrospirota bacterium]HDZ01437.1 hypothetical protein [Nitrospirota bacterium]